MTSLLSSTFSSAFLLLSLTCHAVAEPASSSAAKEPQSFWLVQAEQVEPKLREWQKRHPGLVTLERQPTHGGRSAYAVTLTDTRVEDAGKKRLLFSQPHAHEPATTAGMMDFMSQVLDGRTLTGQPTSLMRDKLLRETVLTFIPNGNPDGRARAPVEWWDGTQFSNDAFLKFAFGRAKDGSRMPRVGRWSTRDLQPEWIGIAYEQLNDHEYVEPNRDLASTYFVLVRRMLGKYEYDAHVDLHQTEFENSPYNAMMLLPFMQRELPEPIRKANDQLAAAVVEAWSRAGYRPMPESKPLGYAEDQIRYFRACWTDLYRARPTVGVEVQNNNRRTPPRDQLRLIEVAIRASIEHVTHAPHEAKATVSP